MQDKSDGNVGLWLSGLIGLCRFHWPRTTFVAAMSDAHGRQTARRSDEVTPMELLGVAAEEIVARGARIHL